jgi:hypothetical protein
MGFIGSERNRVPSHLFWFPPRANIPIATPVKRLEQNLPFDFRNALVNKR